jgi:hypothetical protein
LPSQRFAYHAAAVRSFRRISYPLILALLAIGVACTRDEPQVASPTPTVSGGPVTSNAAVTFAPGKYRYTFNGIDASLMLDASTGVLEIENASGAELAAPVIYAVAQDGTRYDAAIQGSAAIADGSSASLTVTFPDAVKADTAGLIVLSFGSDNVGAFAPVPVGGPSPSA